MLSRSAELSNFYNSRLITVHDRVRNASETSTQRNSSAQIVDVILHFKIRIVAPSRAEFHSHQRIVGLNHCPSQKVGIGLKVIHTFVAIVSNEGQIKCAPNTVIHSLVVKSVGICKGNNP